MSDDPAIQYITGLILAWLCLITTVIIVELVQKYPRAMNAIILAVVAAAAASWASAVLPYLVGYWNEVTTHVVKSRPAIAGFGTGMVPALLRVLILALPRLR